MPSTGNHSAGMPSSNGHSHNNNMLTYSVNSSPHTASLNIRPVDSNPQVPNGNLNLNSTGLPQTTTCEPTERSMLKALYPHQNRAGTTAVAGTGMAPPPPTTTSDGTTIPARRPRHDDSLGGHRMSISSIINQDSPKGATSTAIRLNPHELPQAQAFHHALDQRSHHHLHQPPSHPACHQHLHHHPFLLQPATQTGYSK